MDDLLTPQQAADALGTPVRFVRRLVAERRIAYVKVGRYVRFARSDLEAFAAAGRVEPLSQVSEPSSLALLRDRRVSA